MKSTRPLRLSALLLSVALVLPLAAAAGDLPAHPNELEYGPLDFEVPDARQYRHTLDNGMTVYIVEDPSLPLVDMLVQVRAGAYLDPNAKPGVASLTGTLLRRGGTANRTAEDFDERLDFLAVNLSSFGGSTTSSVFLDSMSPVLDEALALLFEMLKTPGFQADRLEVEKSNRLERLKQRNDQPVSIASREWDWLMYGRGHYAGRSQTSAELESIGRDDLQAFHRQYWHPRNMTIAVSGDVDTETLLRQLGELTADWPYPGETSEWPPPVPEHQPKPGVYYAQKDIPQGRVYIGHPTFQVDDWNNPDLLPLRVMNNVLGGGGFTSRITRRVRSDEGLAYSAGSQLSINSIRPGMFRFSFQTKSSTVAFASQICLEEMNRIRDEKVPADELQSAKNALLEAFPQRFDSAQGKLSTFVNDDYYDRDPSYWQEWRDRLRAVTAEDVQRVAREYLKPDELTFLLVGNWAEAHEGDPEGRATMPALFPGVEPVELPERDPLTLEPVKAAP